MGAREQGADPSAAVPRPFPGGLRGRALRPVRRQVLTDARVKVGAMYDGKSVAVVVPAYNEEALIASTVSTIPDFVDRVIVVDDASTDATVEKARSADPRVDLIVHERNQGVGAAIVS